MYKNKQQFFVTDPGNSKKEYFDLPLWGRLALRKYHRGAEVQRELGVGVVG